MTRCRDAAASHVFEALAFQRGLQRAIHQYFG
jgi:hypothetical protein